MKEHFVDPRDPISIVGFLATFKIPCDTNKIHERAAMWVLRHFVKETLANVLNSHMCAEERSVLIAASVQNKEVRPLKLLQSYPEFVNYLWKKFATEHAIAENNATI